MEGSSSYNCDASCPPTIVSQSPSSEAKIFIRIKWKLFKSSVYFYGQRSGKRQGIQDWGILYSKVVYQRLEWSF